MSQEILPLGNIAAVATFPRIYGRSPTRGLSTELSVLRLRLGIPAKMNMKQYKTLMDYLCTAKFPTDMIKAEKDFFAKKTKSSLVKMVFSIIDGVTSICR